MCGIVGYVGGRPAQPILLAGLRRLEYRGYDSAGLAVLEDRSPSLPTTSSQARPQNGSHGPSQGNGHANGHGALVVEPTATTARLTARMHLRKRVGRVFALEQMLADQPAPGTSGISHTRWATHGPPEDRNAHPHLAGPDPDDPWVAVVHNGVIENHETLRRELLDDGVRFVGQTDSEVIAWLLAIELRRQSRSDDRPTTELDLLDAFRRVLPRLEGTYGLAAVSPLCPGTLVGARFGSPLAVGIGRDEHLLASDPVALVAHTRRVTFLDDGEIVCLTADRIQIEHRDRGPVLPKIDHIDWVPDAVELEGHDHYMIKEIREQPETIRNACRGRILRAEGTAKLGGLHRSAAQLRRTRRIILVGCGTSWHAALTGEYLIERLARIPVEVEYASEFRYRNPPLDDRTLVFVISQSGETADTLAALREAQRRGHPTLALCNTVGSTIAREADGGLYLHAGPEIGVASTKAFLAQVTVLTLLALHLGRLKHLSVAEGQQILDALEAVPERIGQVFDDEGPILRAAHRLAEAEHALFLGRDLMFPVALEGALKLKEISYLPTIGYPTAEMKHGPIALVDPKTPCVFVAPRGPLHAKTLANIEEVRARRGPAFAVGHRDDRELADRVDVLLPIPHAPEIVQPLLAVVPLQLLAYHVARLRGCDIDKPRNLAKSVTVE